MSGFALGLRYYAAKARSALALHRKVREGDSPFAKQALRLAIDHFLRGRLSFVHSETKGESGEKQQLGLPFQPSPPSPVPPSPAPSSVSSLPSSSQSQFREFTRRFLIRRLIAPGHKSLFVGDLVLLALQVEASALEDLAAAAEARAQTPCPSTYPSVERESWNHRHDPSTGLAAFGTADERACRPHAPVVEPPTSSPFVPRRNNVLTGIPLTHCDSTPLEDSGDSEMGVSGSPPKQRQVTSLSVRKGSVAQAVPGAPLAASGVPCIARETSDPVHCSPRSTMSHELPRLASQTPSAAVLRRVAAMEGAEMVSDDPEDEPFTIPGGHCWLVQEEGRGAQDVGSTGGVEDDIDEWDSRRTGPVPCSQILGRAIYVCHSPVHHEPITNSFQAMAMDAPVLAMELDVEFLAHGISSG